MQKIAKKSFHENKNLIDIIKKDKIIKNKINEKKLKIIFEYKKHLKNVNFIFKRVFK